MLKPINLNVLPLSDNNWLSNYNITHQKSARSVSILSAVLYM